MRLTLRAVRARWNLLIGITLGVAIGWAAGILRLPTVDGNDAFWIGFIACLGVVLFLIALLIAWNKNAFLAKVIGRSASGDNPDRAVRAYAIVWVLVAAFIVLGGLLSVYMINRQNKLLETQTQNQNKRIEEQSELIESVRKGNQVVLMSNVLENVEAELNTNGTLSDAIIARVAALSYSFKPYRYFEEGGLSDRWLSPERGQLLLALSLMSIDSTSFDKIKQSTSFSHADLRGAELPGAALGGTNLNRSDFQDANLRGADLTGADLRQANFSGANFETANLSYANLERADLSWAKMNKANLVEAYLDGADMTSAGLRHASLTGASLRYANLNAALFTGASVVGADFFLARLANANFQNANMREANMRRASLSNANLTDAVLAGAIVQLDNWLEQLGNWGVYGADDIQSKYRILHDTSGLSMHRLERLGE